MKRYFIGCLTLFVCLLLGSSICFAQQLITGIPPFSTTTGGSFDAIDLANLNVHFSIPIFSRPGKGIPFNYSLTYNSLIWYPVTSGGTTSWQPVTNRGWAAQGTGLSEWFSYPQTTVNCYDNLGHQSGAVVTLGPYTYYEPSGTPHLINNTLVQISGSNCGCVRVFVGKRAVEKAAPWKVQRRDFPTPLGNSAKAAEFPLFPPLRPRRVNFSYFNSWKTE